MTPRDPARDRPQLGPLIVVRASALVVLIIAAATFATVTLRGASEAPAPSTLRIDLNTATVDELRLLPGIGPALAERIADDRAERGPFTSVDDLARVRGVGDRTVLSLGPFVKVASPGDSGGLD